MKISFHGAARSVTGSMHLLEAGSSKVLLDCGLFQGPREESNRRNRRLPFPSRPIRAAILSHAHIDHSGNLPTLVKSGFRGPIFATAPTAELAALMVRDSARIQEADATYLNRKFPGKKKIVPLYSGAEAEAAVRRFRAVRYHEWFEAAPGIRARFLDAGHIVGSGIVEIEAREGARTVRVVFTGDLGRRGIPILRDPEPLPSCDVILSECTYGDRVHEDLPSLEREMEALLRGCVAERGRILIPAFSVGRTQSILYELARLIRAGKVPPIPVYVDSPLSTETTKLVARHPEVFDEEMRKVVAQEGSPLFFRGVRYVESVEESKSINAKPNPLIIVSASGMCESGRILHHLRNAIGQPCNVIALVGFQAQGTLGRKLQDGWPKVRILGEELEVRARVVRFGGFSAHADRNDLLTALGSLRGANPRVFLVHGEEQAAVSLAAALKDRGLAKVEIPRRGEEFEL